MHRKKLAMDWFGPLNFNKGQSLDNLAVGSVILGAQSKTDTDHLQNEALNPIGLSLGAVFHARGRFCNGRKTHSSRRG